MYSSKATLISITIALACSDVHVAIAVVVGTAVVVGAAVVVAIAVVVGTLDTSPPLLHPERSRAKPKDTETATLPITALFQMSLEAT